MAGRAEGASNKRWQTHCRTQAPATDAPRGAMGSMSARFRHSVLVVFSVLAFTAPATAAADAGSAGARPGRERSLHQRR